MKKMFLLSVLALSFSACTASDPSREVGESVKANAEAENQLEWDRSTVKPEALFEKWHQEKKNPIEVCKGLQGLSGQDLTLFEEEIGLKKNKELVAPCKETLQKTLEDYWASVRPR
ncbi:MAG TPA: hypothetical protein PL182_05315 [Pseudobdellovibrionaceae bacterium]|nr:hypothetical protein [Pseudobdellovibrionaceae bacterium]